MSAVCPSRHEEQARLRKGSGAMRSKSSTRSAREKLKDLLVEKKLKTELVDKMTGKVLAATRQGHHARRTSTKSPSMAGPAADLKESMDLIEKMESVVATYVTQGGPDQDN